MAENIILAEKHLTEADMKILAEKLALELKETDSLLFWGDLGAGKTTFARAVIGHLTSETDIPSPTFTLVQTYEDHSAHNPTIWHYDLYRLSGPEGLEDIGWYEAEADIRLAEWPERLGPEMPQDALHIHIDFPENGTLESRQISLKSASGLWHERLADLVEVYGKSRK